MNHRQHLFLLSALVCSFLADAQIAVYTDSVAMHPSDSILYSNLQEVTVMAKRPSALLKADKIVFRPSEMSVGSSGSAYEAISLLPGISIKSDGNLSIYGVKSLSVNIDGRKTILSGENLINYLKTLPAVDIEELEIIGYSGAKTDGEEPVTILNIVKCRKKDNSYAFGAVADAQSGRARQLYTSIYGEYSKNRHTLSVNYSRFSAHNPSELMTDRPYPDHDERLKQFYDRKRTDSSSQLSVSYDYKFPSGHTVGTSLNYSHFRRKEPAVMTTSIPFEEELRITDNNALFVTDNIFGELYCRRKSSNESEWTAACDFFRYRSSESQLMEDNSGMSIDGSMYGATYGIVGSFDFNRHLSRHWSISAGTRISYVSMRSTGSYIDSHVDSETKPIADDLDSSFGYDENVNAIYAEGKCEYGMLRASVGLRGEHNNLSTYFTGNESSESRDVNRKYFHIFPSLSLMLSSAGYGSWMLAYANKVTRPRFADLDPFIHLFDDITHVGGNINLKEASRHSLTLTWSDNVHWRIMANGDFVSSDIVKYYRELTDRIVYVTPENIPSHLQLLFSATCSGLDFTTWWTVSATANIIYSSYRFDRDTGLNSNVRWTPIIDLKNKFQMPYHIIVEADASYRGSMAFGQARTSHVWNTYFGLKKNFLDGRLSLSVYVKDLFNTNHFNSSILLSGRKAILYEKEFEDMRKVGISISWRINGGIGKSEKKDRNVWIDELNRVNL